jgi:oligopeptide transport system ATP-binding protein
MNTASSTGMLLQVNNLKTYFPLRTGGLFSQKGAVKAVDGVSLAIEKGRTLGLVGESGSGKTTVGKTILGLVPATSGSALFDGIDLFSQSPRAWRSMRKRMQIIFQDPFSSLDPRMTVASIVSEPLIVHERMSPRDRTIRVGELLERVGLSSGYMNRYPHEFSGGQRQRIGIARALASKPEIIICDEPVSALDVSIQAQILNLLRDLQQELGIAYLFIAHNLAVVEHFADRVAVMYLGKIVESAGSGTLYSSPVHPYTKALLSAVPNPDPKIKSGRIRLSGETPSPVNPPPGCPFHPRCFHTRTAAKVLPDGDVQRIQSDREEVIVAARCVWEVPALAPCKDNPDHFHSCLLLQ